MTLTRRTVLTTGALGALASPLALAGVPGIVQTVERLLAMEQEWLAQRDYANNYPDESDEACEPLYLRLEEIEERIYVTPAQTLRGVVVKLRLWGHYYGPFDDLRYEDAWWQGDLSSMDLCDKGFAWVMHDLERLAGEAQRARGRL